MAHAHEAHEHLRHAEVTKAPGQSRHDGDNAIGAGVGEQRSSVLHDLIAGLVQNGRGYFGARQEAGDGLQKRHGVVDAARRGHRADEHGHQREEHERSLNEVGRAHRKVPAHERVQKYDERADNHHGRVIPAEERGEQFSAGDKARTGINTEEQEDDDGGNGHEDMLVIVKAI